MIQHSKVREFAISSPADGKICLFYTIRTITKKSEHFRPSQAIYIVRG